MEPKWRGVWSGGESHQQGTTLGGQLRPHRTSQADFYWGDGVSLCKGGKSGFLKIFPAEGRTMALENMNDH